MLTERDALLKVLSAEGIISWQRFKQCVDILAPHTSLGNPEGNTKPSLMNWRLARALDALGHCEVTYGAKDLSIGVLRPSLVLLPQSGQLTAVLAGARSNSLLKRMQHTVRLADAKLSVLDQPSDISLSPSRVAIDFLELATLKEIADECGLDHGEVPAAVLLSATSGTLRGYLAAGSWRPHRLMNWRVQEFSLQQLRFVDDLLETPEVRLLKYTESVSRRTLYVFVRGNDECEVLPEWGRYAVLSDYGLRVLVYDKRSFQFAVPVTLPLPKLLARALCLCSGFSPIQKPVACLTPNISQVSHVNVYRSVPPRLAYHICNKVGQPVTEGTIEL